MRGAARLLLVWGAFLGAAGQVTPHCVKLKVLCVQERKFGDPCDCEIFGSGCLDGSVEGHISDEASEDCTFCSSEWCEAVVCRDDETKCSPDGCEVDYEFDSFTEECYAPSTAASTTTALSIAAASTTHPPLQTTTNGTRGLTPAATTAITTTMPAVNENSTSSNTTTDSSRGVGMPVAAPAVAANASLVAIPATISANSDGNLGSTSSVTENLREKGQGGEARLNSTGEGNGSATPSSKNSKSEGLAASLSVVALLLLVIIILIAKRLQKQISRKKLDAALRARSSLDTAPELGMMDNPLLALKLKEKEKAKAQEKEKDNENSGIVGRKKEDKSSSKMNPRNGGRGGDGSGADRNDDSGATYLNSYTSASAGTTSNNTAAKTMRVVPLTSPERVLARQWQGGSNSTSRGADAGAVTGAGAMKVAGAIYFNPATETDVAGINTAPFYAFPELFAGAAVGTRAPTTPTKPSPSPSQPTFSLSTPQSKPGGFAAPAAVMYPVAALESSSDADGAIYLPGSDAAGSGSQSKLQHTVPSKDDAGKEIVYAMPIESTSSPPAAPVQPAQQPARSSDAYATFHTTVL